MQLRAMRIGHVVEIRFYLGTPSRVLGMNISSEFENHLRSTRTCYEVLNEFEYLVSGLKIDTSTRVFMTGPMKKEAFKVTLSCDEHSREV